MGYTAAEVTAMSFGRNPHVAKAEAAEQKAREARDELAHAPSYPPNRLRLSAAWREAARQWERAASREKSDKLRREYSEKAEAARANADREAAPEATPSSSDEDTVPVINTRSPKVLH
jgi:hypothetical protein